jgi:hypothetical protein
MKTYILNAETHICLDDVDHTIIAITSSSYIENIAIAYTKDANAYYGMADKLIQAVSGSYNFGNGAPPFLASTEEDFNRVREEVFTLLNNM